MRPTLFFLNGWAMDDTIWDSLRNVLPSYPVRFVNWYGIEGIEEFRERARRQIAEETHVVLVGWSLGAMVALDIATSSSVVGMVLIGATARFIEDVDYRGWKAAHVKRLQRTLTANQERALEKFDASMFTEEETRCLSIRTDFREDTLSSLQLGLSYLQTQDCRSILSTLQLPMVLIHGEEDCVCSVEGAQYIAHHTNAKLHTLANTGHVPHITKASTCATIIQEFLIKEVEHD